MFCRFGHTKSSYVAFPFILRGSTATSSTTGVYVVVPERLGQSEEAAGRNEGWTTKEHSLFFSSGFNRLKM